MNKNPPTIRRPETYPICQNVMLVDFESTPAPVTIKFKFYIASGALFFFVVNVLIALNHQKFVLIVIRKRLKIF